MFFGKEILAGVESISDMSNTISGSTQVVTFEARIVFNEETIPNQPPLAYDKDIHIRTDSVNNVIMLQGKDENGDPISFHVQVQPRFGKMVGDNGGGFLVYTPNSGYVGKDCFSYVVNDGYFNSKAALVEIEVSKNLIPNHIVRYEMSGRLKVTGNYFYDVGDGVWRRGRGGYIYPPSGELAKGGAFSDPTQWTATGGAFIEGHTAHFNGTSNAQKVTQHSDDITNGQKYYVEVNVTRHDSGELFVRIGDQESNVTAALGGLIGTFKITMPGGAGGEISLFSKSNRFKGEADYIKVYDHYSDHVRIASLDHSVHGNNDIVSCTIEKWGSRVDYTGYLRDQAHLKDFDVDEGAGACHGVMFDWAFAGTTAMEEFPELHLGYGESFLGMFSYSGLKGIIPPMTFARGKVFARMYEHTKNVTVIGKMGTPKGENFERMFESSYLGCLGGIDTTAGISKYKMFYNTPNLRHPTTAEQTDITDANGKNWVGPSCGATITSIKKKSGTETCEIGDIGTTCDSTGVYQVYYAHSHGTVTYQWYVSGGGVIVGSSTAVTVSVKVTSGNVNGQVMKLRCKIKDTLGQDLSAWHSFKHKRTTGYIQLVLPKSYTQINLRTYINAHAAGRDKIYISNNVPNCSVTTGSLSGLHVTFQNNSILSGFAKGRTDANASKNSGFIATSDITFINRGWVRGAGGYGGKGGTGKNSTTTSTKEVEEFDTTLFTQSNGNKTYRTSWQAYCDGCGAIRIFYNAQQSGMDGSCSKTQIGPYRRGKLKMHPHSTVFIYSIVKTVKTHGTKYGGAPGFGGRGDGYNQVNQKGGAGKISSPSGGNSGGAGGWGGSFGRDGHTGHQGAGGGSGGQRGYHAAPGLIGKNHCVGVSKIGNVLGAIVS